MARIYSTRRRDPATLRWPTIAIKRGTKLDRKSKLDDHQQREAMNRLKAGESLRAIAKSYRVHHATIGRLSAELEEMRVG